MLITGSSRGIGAAIARLAKEKGYEDLLHGRTHSQQLMELAKELDSKYLIFDISKENEVMQALSKITQINFLVNSAGLNISKTFDDLNDTDWKAVYDVNIFGLVNVIRHAVPIMKRSQSIGKIINIAAIKGLYASVGRVA